VDCGLRIADCGLRIFHLVLKIRNPQSAIDDTGEEMRRQFKAGASPKISFQFWFSVPSHTQIIFKFQVREQEAES
jgi:hypothetical protein